MNEKPLGTKAYGSIPHLPKSRIGQGDHHCHPGQAFIACVKTRDKHDIVIVQEKLDGSNVCIAKHKGNIIALTRAGYSAITSPYSQHHVFDAWVKKNYSRFNSLLNEGERLCGEWLYMAHGTMYCLFHEPFVAFDLFQNGSRVNYETFLDRTHRSEIIIPSFLILFKNSL